MVTITPISALKDNYIWALTDDNRTETWIVDPGEAGPVIQYLEKEKLILAGILITHHHFDHSAGAPQLLNYIRKKIPIYAGYQSPHAFVTHRMQEGDEINGGFFKLSVMEIPGHTLDHIAYYNNDMLFCGDTLFSAGCGRIFEGTAKQMLDSLNKLKKLPETTPVFCGHEYTLANLNFAKTVEPQNHFIQQQFLKIKTLRDAGQCTLLSTIGIEKQMNPFFRCDEKILIDALQDHTQQKFTDPVAVFSYLREWKNKF